MNPKEIEQIKSYSTLLVAELHKMVFEDKMFDRSKAILKLAEELECFMWELELKRKEAAKNVFTLKRIA